jgi:hypothetical protein
MAPSAEAIIKFLVLHDFSNIHVHLACFLPQFLPEGSSFFGKERAAHTSRRISNIPDLLQAFTGMSYVFAPFLNATEVSNISEMSSFVSLVPTHMLGVAGSEEACLGAFFQASTELYEDWATNTTPPDSAMPTIASLISSSTFVATTNRLTLKAQVALAIGPSTTPPGTGVSTRNAAPATSAVEKARKTKRKRQPSALEGLSPGTAPVLKEWRTLGTKHCAAHPVPKSTGPPCFFFHNVRAWRYNV